MIASNVYNDAKTLENHLKLQFDIQGVSIIKIGNKDYFKVIFNKQNRSSEMELSNYLGIGRNYVLCVGYTCNGKQIDWIDASALYSKYDSPLEFKDNWKLMDHYDKCDNVLDLKEIRVRLDCKHFKYDGMFYDTGNHTLFIKSNCVSDKQKEKLCKILDVNDLWVGRLYNTNCELFGSLDSFNTHGWFYISIKRCINE